VGKVDMLDVLTDLTAVLGSEIEYVSQEAERFQALAALEPLLGRELIQVRVEPEAADGSPGARRSPADGGGSAGVDHE